MCTQVNILRWLGGCIVLALTGCAAAPSGRMPVAYDLELISGIAVFGEEIRPAPVMDLLTTSPDMVAFVDADITSSHFSYTRFRKLLAKMIKTGFFIDQYDRAATYSASRTFAEKKGNCIAYTNLFVALSRQAGLRASYQVVDSPPTWNVESGYLVRNNHVNVLLEDVAYPGVPEGELTVDFNSYQADPETPTTRISDAYAASMFYANLAVERLHAGDSRGSFAYLKRAILTEPGNSDLWNNLGALYSIVSAPTLAQQSYETALQISPKDKSALAGMAKAFRQQGRFEEAEVYAALALKYQAKNPYYHYALAEQAFHNDAFVEALTAVNEAISLEKNNARFYALRAATAAELGDEALEQKSLRLQRRHNRGRPDQLTPWLNR